MRAAGWIVLGLAAVLLSVIIGAGWVATRAVNTPGNRARILALAEETLGREVSAGGFSVGLFPAVFGVAEVQVSGETREAPALLEARHMDLKLALVPLFAGAVAVDSLVMEDPLLRLVRTERGLELPNPTSANEARLLQPVAPGGTPVAVRSIAVRDGRIHFEDRTLSPSRIVEIQGIDFSIRRHSVELLSDLEFSVTPEAGGTLHARGTGSTSGGVEIEGEFRDFTLDSISPFVAFASRLEGRASGTVRHRGRLLAPERWVGDLQLRDARVWIGEFEISGVLGVHFDVSRPFADAEGRFSIDATAADVRLGGVYAKPPGRPADLTGRFVSVEGRLGVDDLHLRIGEPVAGRPGRGWRVASRRSTSWRTGERDGFEWRDHR